MEHLAVVRIRALTTPSPEVERAKAQEVTLKTIDESTAETDD
jgi:hypothetical protein